MEVNDQLDALVASTGKEESMIVYSCWGHWSHIGPVAGEKYLSPCRE